MDVSLNKSDAFISWPSNYPIEVSEEHLPYYTNPGVDIKVGDLIHQMVIWKEGESSIWSEKPSEKLNGQYFPQYFSLEDTMKGKEGETIELKVKGIPFNFTCRNYESFFTHTNKYRSQKTNSRKPFDIEVYRNKLNNPTIAPVIEKIYSFASQEIPTYTNKTLKETYERNETLGAGGQGAVFKVKGKNTKEFHAFKISTCPIIFPEVFAIINYVLDKNLSPHLTRMNKIMLIENVVRQYNVFNESPNFVNDLEENKKSTKASGFEMELLEGDISNLKLSPIEEKIVAVQSSSIIGLLIENFKTVVSDCKYRNIFYKKLTKSDLFKGKPLMDFDYWKYTFGNIELFLPKMKYLIKLGDYDSWMSNFCKTKFSFYQPFTSLEILSSKADINKLLTLFPKPADLNAKILDMEVTHD